MNKSFPKGVEVVAAALIKDLETGKFFIAKSTKWGGRWVCPGGHVEPGESIFETVIREIQEETGLAIKPIEIIASYETIDSSKYERPIHFVVFHVLAHKIDGEVAIDATELTEYIWADLDELEKYDFVPDFKSSFKKIGEK